MRNQFCSLIAGASQMVPRTHSGHYLILLLAVYSIVLSGCGGGDTGNPRSEGVVVPPNVILISIDTLRADHLGAYGYPRGTSPSVDRLAKESILFESAIAHAPSTLPSHASILTSLLPAHHGALYRLDTPLAESARTVTEILQEAGYATAAFTGGGQLDAIWGLDQGFDRYDSLVEASFADVAEAGLEWVSTITADGGEPFFLFLHTYEVHHPYTPAPERLALFDQGYDGALPDHILIAEHLQRINSGELQLSPADLEHIVNTYDAEIHSMDEALGEFLEALSERNLYDRSLIVFTSDHGEEFGEHGAVGWHSHTLYDELLHVPLILKMPHGRLAGTEVATTVRSIDIAPTILTTLQMQPPADFDGLSLQRVMNRTPEPTLPVFSMIEPKTDQDFKAQTFGKSLRKGPWKLFNQSLFHLTRDPGEMVNLAPEQEDVAGSLADERQEILNRRRPLRTETVEVPQETKEQLRALGYIN